MKKTIFILSLLLIPLFGWTQVTTNPTFITQTGGSFDILFDASAGSAGLKGLTTGVYAHIGVITSASTSDTDWKYVLTSWPTSATDATANTTKNALTYVSANQWKLTISPNIQDFLGVPSTETIKKIALVFRNAAGTLTGKTTAGGDILIDVYSAGLNLTFLNPRPTPAKPGMPLDHLSMPDAERLIKEIKPKIAILTHFGMGVWRAKPVLVAEELTQKTGIKVIAATDGMTFDLANLDK